MTYHADHKGIHGAGEQVVSRPSGMPDDLWRKHAQSVCLALCAAAGTTYTGRIEAKPFDGRVNRVGAGPYAYMVKP